MEEIKREQESEPHEMDEQGKNVVRLFQEAQASKENEVRIKLLREFYEKLMKSLLPEGREFQPISDERIVKTIEGDGNHPYFSPGAGTAGQRIFFESSITIPKGEDPAKYGYDLKPTEFLDDLELESKDRRNRWMHYPKPQFDDWRYGQEYWESFYKHFGSDIVDLYQKLEDKV